MLCFQRFRDVLLLRYDFSLFSGWSPKKNGQAEEFDRRGQLGRRQREGEERQSVAHDFPAEYRQTSLAW